MRTNWRTWLALGALGGTVTALVVAGCGGSGGPVQQPETGSGQSPTAQFLALLPAAQRTATVVGTATCAQAACHGGANSIAAQHSGTVHTTRNVTCESCHGPGSIHAAAPAKDNILTFPNSTSELVCGQCHGPTHTQFETSRHAGVVSGAIASASKTCLRCHSTQFRIQMMDTPLAQGKTTTEMEADITALSAAQMAAFRDGTGSSAACTTCHNPHAQSSNLTSSGNQAHLRRATASQDTAQVGPGATVTNYSTFNHMCASCHNGRGANPSDTALHTASRPNMHDSNQYNMLLGFSGFDGSGPPPRASSHKDAADQCMKCHMPERRHTFTTSYDKSCSPCHTTADAAQRSQVIRSETQNGLFALKDRMERWAEAALGNRDFWEYPALLTAEGITPPNQSLVPIAVKRARHNYYFVVRDASYGVHNTPYTRHLLTVAHEELDPIVSRAASRSASPEALGRMFQQDRARASKADIAAMD